MYKRKNEEQYQENRYLDGKHYSKKKGGKTEKRISRNNQKIDIRDYQ